MKQVVSEKYNVAWFKLADYIARGEKERALGMYRLLSHSFDDPALACQLKADILLSFGDTVAESTYKQAANMYQEQGRILQAAAVYEHLITLQPENIQYRSIVIELYEQLGITSKVVAYVQALLHHLLEKDEWKQAIDLIQRFESAADAAYIAQLHETILLYLLASHHVLPDTIMDHVRAAIDVWQEMGDERAIERLLAKMAALDAKMENYARAYWERK